MRMTMQFDEKQHKYFYNGKEMSGVTGVIGIITGKEFPKSIGNGKGIHHINVARDEGKAIHSVIEYFIDTGKVHPEANDDALWIVESLKKRYPVQTWTYLAEVKVTDKKYFASSIDIVCIMNGTNKAVLIDIKTGNFEREYCSWQLGMYKYMLELEGKFNVIGTEVFCSKDEMVFTIYPKSEGAVKEAFSKYKTITPQYKLEQAIIVKKRRAEKRIEKQIKEKTNG